MKFSSPPIAGILLRRYKRFFADVRLADGGEVTAHCPNTGSMTGCAVPGSPVHLSVRSNPSRKLPYTLEIVEVDGTRIGVNTGLTNRLVEEAIRNGALSALKGYPEIRREVRLGESRIDLLLQDGEKRCYVEVKNVALAKDGVASFPDAVTTRGTRHLLELQQAASQGNRAVICYAVQREDCRVFTPADAIDPVYGETLRRAHRSGVEIVACRARVNPEEIVITRTIPWRL